MMTPVPSLSTMNWETSTNRGGKRSVIEEAVFTHVPSALARLGRQARHRRPGHATLRKWRSHPCTPRSYFIFHFVRGYRTSRGCGLLCSWVSSTLNPFQQRDSRHTAAALRPPRPAPQQRHSAAGGRSSCPGSEPRCRGGGCARHAHSRGRTATSSSRRPRKASVV